MKNKEKKMTIGIDVRNIGRKKTGSEVVVLELTKNILKLDNKNKYILFTDTTDEKILKYIKAKLEIKNKSNVKVVSLVAKNKFVWTIWSLPYWIRTNSLDIYHTEYILPFFISKKTKAITHIHDVSFKVYRKFIKKLDLLFLNILIPMTIRRADKIIAVSEFTKREIEKYYPQAKGKIEIVYNSTNLSETINLSKKEEIINKYNIPKKFIFYVGTLQPRKNVARLISAYAKIKHKIPEIKLVIAGNKQGYNFDKEIDINIKKNNLKDSEVLFIGFIEEEAKTIIYSLAHIFVSPSFYEGFSITPMEAIKMNLPTIISDIPVHREIYKDACLYFKPKDVDNLSKKLYTICTDESLRTSLIERGLVRASFFSWKKSAKKMLEIYNLLN